MFKKKLSLNDFPNDINTRLGQHQNNNRMQYLSTIISGQGLRTYGTVDFVTSEHFPAQPVPYCRNFIFPSSER